MILAWFRPAQPDRTDPLDDTAALMEELRAVHGIVVFTERDAHEFVWRHFRRPFDLCVFELDNTAAHQFIWPYLLQYGGVTMLRTVMLNESRAAALTRERRGLDYRAELAFSGDWRMLRAPLLASRAVVLPHQAVADALQEKYPTARVRHAPIGVTERAVSQGARAGRDVVAGILGGTLDADVIRRACQRARDAGAAVTLMGDDAPARVLRDADIILALHWPIVGEPETAALAGMAAAKAVVVMESEVTADWPACDPQTWRPRGAAGGRPVVVSVDPRDEEHSLMVAVRDLSRDGNMRRDLGAAAHEWWRQHATVRHAADAWLRILSDAVALEPPPRPADWPAHLTADGTEAARALLGEMGATVDFL